MNLKHVYIEAYNRKLAKTKDRKKSRIFAEACVINVKKRLPKEDNNKKSLDQLQKLTEADLWQIK